MHKQIEGYYKTHQGGRNETKSNRFDLQETVLGEIHIAVNPKSGGSPCLQNQNQTEVPIFNPDTKTETNKRRS